MNASEAAGLRPALSAFGHLLKRLRGAANLTQGELAERAGVSERLISDYERGAIRRPRRDTVLLLAKGLHLADPERERFIQIARGREDSGHELAEAVPEPLSNLPVAPNRLVGRDSDVDDLSALLLRQDTRLLTLIGPGGVGKTRLAVEIATRTKPHFPGGTYFIDLAPVQDPELVLATIARVIGVKPSNELPAHARLVNALNYAHLLLVLDNFEHLAAAACDIANLLTECDQVKILATSRAPLRVRAELPYSVEPLELPDLDHLPSIDELARIPAIDLFLNRATTADRSFTLTIDNAGFVAEITIRLEGLPLALELAAARLLVLPPYALLNRLDRMLPVLTGGARDLPLRLQAMRATIDWSYQLLEPNEQKLFRCLALFAGGFTLHAAESVCEIQPIGPAAENGESTEEFLGEPVIDTLVALVDKSLLRVRDDSSGERRFRMLATIREFGLEQLSAADEERDARNMHLDWCLDLVERAEPKLMGPEQSTWLNRLDLEHDNLRSALTWAIDREQADVATRICGANVRFWILRGHSDEARRWLERALALGGDLSPAVKAQGLLGLGAVAVAQGDYQRALVLESALELFRDQDDIAGVAATLNNLGKMAQSQGDHVRSTKLYEESLELFRRLDDQMQVGAVLRSLGLGAYDQGDYGRAATLLGEALTLARSLGEGQSAASSLNNLALVALERGEYDRATALQQEALREWLLLGYKNGIAHSFENLALIAAPQLESDRAAQLFAAAETLRYVIGSPGRLIDQLDIRRQIDVVQVQMDETEFAEAWELGRSMALEDAIALALETSN